MTKPKDEAPPMESPVALMKPQTDALAPLSDSDRAMALFDRAFEAGGATPEALEKLIALKTQVDERAAALEFAAAMREFQRRCPAIPKTSTAKIATKSGGGYSYTFADFEQIVEVVRPILGELGLSFTFDAEVSANGAMLTCTCWLRHVNGHAVASKFVVPTDTASAMSSQQKMAAAMTFAKRNALTAALGLSLTEAPDLDGAESSDHATVNEEQVASLRALLEETNSNEAAFLKWCGVASLGEIRSINFERAVKALEAKRGRP